MNFQLSRCRGAWLHKYATVNAKEDAVLERCLRCGKKHAFKLQNGVPKAEHYAQHHLREFLIPQHRLFAHEYARNNT